MPGHLKTKDAIFRVCLNCKSGLKILVQALKYHFCPKTIKSLRRNEILTFGQHALMHMVIGLLLEI